MENKKVTTKAAKCPKCKQYHAVCSIDLFKRDKSVQREYAKMMRDGFEIVDVGTDDARSNFGYCD